MAWSVAEAKQKLSEVLRNASREPQTIVSRSRPVAVVVSIERFEELSGARGGRATRTVGEAFAELREQASAGALTLRLPRRRNRADGFRARRR